MYDVVFHGLSTGKRLFYDKSYMDRIVLYMRKNAPVSYFIVADKPKRHNLMAIEGYSQQDALRKALGQGDDLERFIAKYHTVPILRWSHIEQLRVYQHNLQVLQSAWCSNSTFRQDCQKLVLEFLQLPANLQKIHNSGIHLSKAVEIASQYVVEELALLTGFPVTVGGKVLEIYPGRHDIQESINEKRYGFEHQLYLNAHRWFEDISRMKQPVISH